MMKKLLTCAKGNWSLGKFAIYYGTLLWNVTKWDKSKPFSMVDCSEKPPY